MRTEGIAIRGAGKAHLEQAFSDAHARTWATLADLTAAQWNVPYEVGINPPLWEFGHVAWFTEWWILREGGWNERGESMARHPSLLPGADAWFDSSRIAHRDRWILRLPPLEAIRAYTQAVHEAVDAKLRNAAETDPDLYFFRLALFHEDMHGEALTYMRQTLSYPTPFPACLSSLVEGSDPVEITGGWFAVGSAHSDGFVFDNEKWAHEVLIAPFTMDTQCVSNGAYAEFVAAGGYRDERWWSDDGRAWLRVAKIAHPRLWRMAAGGGYEQRWFDEWRPVPPREPVCHVNAFEAEAFCKWAGRRLPTESEWEFAASHELIEWGGCVWEWTANDFAPYPGFSPDPYRDYSQPWFHTHRSVRGGSFATQPRMHHPRYRNFYLPHRNDIFVGFRTCAP